MFHAVQLSKVDPTPLYIQLATELAKLIQRGILPQNTKLPTIRFLSKELMINRDTVVSAYKLLEHQGLVEAYVGKGTYVSCFKTEVLNPYTHLDEHLIYCSHLSFSKKFFPTSLCKEITQHIIDTEGWDAFNDPLYRERTLLKQNVCHFFKYLEIEATSAQVGIIQDWESFLLKLFKYFPRQGICVEAPRDLSASSYLHSIGAKIYEVPISSQGLDLDCLEKYLRTGTIAYIMLSPCMQNPTGVCYTPYIKQKIVQLAQTYDCYIIEDGTLSDFSFLDPLPLYHHFSKERVIYVYHFSKVYLPSMRYTFVALPSNMIGRFPDTIACSFNERFLRYYLDSPQFKENRTQMILSSREKYNLVLSGLKRLKDKIEIFTEAGGVSLWLKPLILSSHELVNVLIQNHIIVSPGSVFTLHSESQYVRLSLSHLTLEQTEQVVALLHTTLSRNA